MSKRQPYQIDAAPKSAKKYWKSIEAKENPSAVEARVDAEFPMGTGDLPGVSRRGFLQIAGATTALLGLEGCARRPVEKILPFSKAPEYLNPGVPMHFATVMERRGEAVGLLVNCYEGRPTKIEGNPEHPTSRGATDVLTQASILDLYDPDRSHTPAVVANGSFTNKTFADWDAELAKIIQGHTADKGAGLRILAQPTNSPSFLRLREAIKVAMPEAKFHTWTAINDSNAREGARIAFGQVFRTRYDLAKTKTILALESDFTQTEAGSVMNSRGLADGRRLINAEREISRFYAVESTHSSTGANADHRLALPAAQIGTYLAALANKLGTAHGLDLGPVASAVAAAKIDVPAHWLDAVAKELADNKGHSAIVVGSQLPAAVHALAHLLNSLLGNAGQAVRYAPIADTGEANQLDDIKALASDLDGGKVKTLFILGGNPAFDAPTDLNFAQKLAKAATRVHFSAMRDETSAACTWQIPRAHELETWGDQKSFDGTVSIQQPLISPLFGGRSDIETLAQLAGEPNWRGYYVVRNTMKNFLPTTGLFDAEWRRALHSGIALRAEATNDSPAIDAAKIAEGVATLTSARNISKDNLEVVFLADPKLLDGRHANNAWLLELPDPMTRIVWDNAAYVSPRTATELGLKSGDVVRLAKGSATVEIPVWILPGNAHYSIGLNLGWGRKGTGRYGKDVGFDAYPLRTTAGLNFTDGVTLTKTGAKHILSQTQDHHDMAGRPIAIEATLEEFKADPNLAVKRSPTPRTLPLWREIEYKGHKWGLTIDLNACTGCNACVIACQSENNIPTVGKEMVARGREMHWIRIDRYFIGDDLNELEGVAFQPLGCQQCEDAPCENVCPVNATAHTPEGLNDMSYNRCIGTRYCANNCPYKVRRFNYLNWQINHEPSGEVPETKKMQFNPNVTVRTRGVMEKCTYCVQRIEMARIATRISGRDLRDGDINTACAQACPAQAITFGDLNNRDSVVSKYAGLSRHYKLLAEIGTQPRTTYLARIRNTNPAFPSTNHSETHG